MKSPINTSTPQLRQRSQHQFQKPFNLLGHAPFARTLCMCTTMSTISFPKWPILLSNTTRQTMQREYRFFFFSSPSNRRSQCKHVSSRAIVARTATRIEHSSLPRMVRYSKPGRDASSSATADESSESPATAGEGVREGERRRASTHSCASARHRIWAGQFLSCSSTRSRFCLLLGTLPQLPNMTPMLPVNSPT